MRLPFPSNCRAGARFLLSSLLLLSVVSARATAPAAPSLEFIPNKGQWAAPVRYTAAMPGGRLFLQNNALTYSLLSPEAYRHHGEQAKEQASKRNGRVAGHD